MRILAADIGFGTTDILVFDSEKQMENCPRLVVPSRTQLIAHEIAAATRRGLPAAMVAFRPDAHRMLRPRRSLAAG